MVVSQHNSYLIDEVLILQKFWQIKKHPIHLYQQIHSHHTPLSLYTNTTLTPNLVLVFNNGDIHSQITGGFVATADTRLTTSGTDLWCLVQLVQDSPTRQTPAPKLTLNCQGQ